MFLIAVGSIVYLASGPGTRRGISITQEMGDGTSRIVRIGTGGVAVEHVGHAEPYETKDASGLPVSVDPALRARAGLADRGEIMVLRDPIGFEKSTRPLIDEQIGGLREAGFTLRGEADAAGVEDDPGEMELLAEIRNELGLTPFNTTDAREIIQNWLDRYERIVALVWIGRDDDAAANAWVVGRRGVNASLIDLASSRFMAVERRR